MLERDAEDITIAEGLPPAFSSTKGVHSLHKRTLPLDMLFFGLAFVICTLLMVTPLHRMVGSPFIGGLLTSKLLKVWGVWLPSNLHFSTKPIISQLSTDNIIYLTLTAIAFIIYGFSIWAVRRQPREGNMRHIVSIIGLVTFICGMIFVLTPAMLSHDIFVYAGYGRLIVAHHANPYFTTPRTFPNDPLTPLNDWSRAIAAYGPVWLNICASFALVFGTHPLRYIIAFRLLGLFAHLLNALLIYKILQNMGRSPRTVMLGTLLYAWNPLALMESSLGGHNDTVMVTFILWGILLYVRGEQRGLTRLSSYLPPIIAFTLAALIKFTCGPLIIFFLVILVRNLLSTAEGHISKESIRSNWKLALLHPLIACIVGALLALGFYIPYWVGHSIPSILTSFLAPPSSRFVEFSILSAIDGWITQYGNPPTPWQYTLLKLFSNHNVWNIINAVIITITIIIGIVWLWRKPTVHVFILATLLMFGSLLIVTPWFFPWYVVLPVALASILLPNSGDLIGRALTAFVLAFSASAYAVYFFSHVQPFGSWIGLDFLTTIGPPMLAFLLVIIFRKLGHSPILRSFRFVLSHRGTKT